MPLRVADQRLWFNLPGVVAAYQPIVAPDALTARQNMALGGDGRYVASPGAAPTWASSVGWTFNGTDQWLSAGAVLTNDQSWSFILRYSGASGTNRAIALSRTGTGTTDFGVYISDYTATYVYNGSYLLVNHSSITGGVWAITGNGAYLNGAAVTGTISAGSGTATVAFPIGAMDDDGARSLWYAGNIQAVAIYNRKLTAAEVWLASQQLARCEFVADYSAWAPVRRWFLPPPPAEPEVEVSDPIEYDKDGVAIYTPPARFAHLDYLQAAALNKLSAGILAAYERLFQRTIQLPTYQGETDWSVFHRLDVLIYRTPDVDGMQPQLSPLDEGVGDPISLPESRDRYVSFDLTSVDWLAPGMFYRLSDVAGAFEDWTELLYA